MIQYTLPHIYILYICDNRSGHLIAVNLNTFISQSLKKLSLTYIIIA